LILGVNLWIPNKREIFMKKESGINVVVPYTTKYIPIRDFVYLCIILSIVLISIVTMVLSNSTRAGENLNFAATAVSIVLAILAIVITLTDSSSQKESIKKLEDLVNIMDGSVNNTRTALKESISKSEEHVKTLITLKEELKKHYEDSFDQLRSNLHKMIEKDNPTLTKEVIDTIIENSIEKMNKDFNNKSSIKSKTEFEIEMNSMSDFIEFKFNNNDGIGYLPHENFMEFIKNSLLELGFPKDHTLEFRAETVFNYLLKNKKFYYVKSEKGYSTIPF
jgi:uncharacterized membrane-anchored protein YhcB (DUF1043 family)